MKLLTSVLHTSYEKHFHRPPWPVELQSLLEKARLLLDDCPLPHVQQEQWRYSSPQNILETQVTEGRRELTHDRRELENQENPSSQRKQREYWPHEIQFSDGVCAYKNLPLGVHFYSWKDLFDPDPTNLNSATAESTDSHFYSLKNFVLEQFSQGLENSPDYFSLLNFLFIKNGGVLCVERDVKINEPLLLDFQFSFTSLSSAFSKIFIYAKENSSIHLVENITGDSGENHFISHETFVSLGKNAQVELSRINTCGENTGIFSTKVHQLEKSQLKLVGLQSSGKWTRHEWASWQKESFAETEFYGAYSVKKQEHVDFRSSIYHEVPGGKSEQKFKGILQDHSRAVLNGKIKIAKGADKTEAHLLNNNLMLSQGAEVDTKPELEIFADDVKATHGATLGRLDEDEIFYLRSRALSENAARELLSQAFVREICFLNSSPRVQKLFLSQLATNPTIQNKETRLD